MHGLVVQYEQGHELRTAILWNDSRATDQCQHLKTTLPSIEAITSIAPMPTSWPAKLWWLLHNETQMFDRVRYFLLPKDYVRWRMRGTRVTDMCDAAVTLLLDQVARTWSKPAVSVSRSCRV